MTFGAKLQSLRMDAGWSQEELASRLGVSRQAVSKWELDKTIPDAATIVAVSELFRVSTDYLLKNRETTPPPRVSAQTPPPTPPPDEPSRARTACILLNCGNVLSLTLLLFSLFKLVFLRADSVIPLVCVLLALPTLLAVSQGLMGNGARSPAVLLHYRRGAASAVVLMGFSAALLLGQAAGAASLPILLGLLALLLWGFWLLCSLLAHRLIQALKRA